MILDKFKEVLATVLPISILVLILSFTIVPIETPDLIKFIIGAVCIIIGLTVFLLGVDVGITPIGELMGSEIVKTNREWFVVVAGIVLGFVISVAEPDLHILAAQVSEVTGGVVGKDFLVIVVSVGVAIMIGLGLLRIVKRVKLSKFLFFTYLLILALAIFGDNFFLAIAFDASGATTGALTVPFILALAAGVSRMNRDSETAEIDSFGLVGIASAGAILGVLFLGVVNDITLNDAVQAEAQASLGILESFVSEIPGVSRDILIALAPIALIYIISNKIHFKQDRRSKDRIYFGLLLTFLGLVIFLVGVNAGFMRIGHIIGEYLGSLGNDALVVFIAFLLGVLTILAEPAVHVLTDQIEDVTAGYVKRSTVLATLSVGVGFAVALSIIKILVPNMQLWHLLLPGYIVAFILSRKVPELFVGIAFDSGGVASGPMTATFILAYAQGVATVTPTADLLTDGFGTIAMVAMTPLIALQLLGLVYEKKSRKVNKDE